jgi:phosphatidylcholine synthase
MANIPPKFSILRQISGWLIHLFTASAAIVGLFSLYAIYQGRFLLAFWLMGVTIFIDSIDGTLARRVGVKDVVPKIDGTLLDNIVDYLNYVITPAFFLLVSDLLPGFWKVIGASAIVLASAYQFTQADAKTSDNFFKGFPSYWNLVVFYLFLAEMSPWFNFFIIIFLSFMIFVPIKYLYLTRIDNVTSSKPLRALLMLATFIYALATIMLLATYPDKNPVYIAINWFFGILYVFVSLYRTFIPMNR